MAQEEKAVAVPITDSEEVKKLVTVRRPPGMSDEEFRQREKEIISMIAESGALLRGHFTLGPDQD